MSLYYAGGTRVLAYASRDSSGGAGVTLRELLAWARAVRISPNPDPVGVIPVSIQQGKNPICGPNIQDEKAETGQGLNMQAWWQTETETRALLQQIRNEEDLTETEAVQAVLRELLRGMADDDDGDGDDGGYLNQEELRKSWRAKGQDSWTCFVFTLWLLLSLFPVCFIGFFNAFLWFIELFVKAWI